MASGSGRWHCRCRDLRSDRFEMVSTAPAERRPVNYGGMVYQQCGGTLERNQGYRSSSSVDPKYLTWDAPGWGARGLLSCADSSKRAG